MAATKASVGVAIIAKDAQATIGPCLDSIRPYVSQIVVGVDERTTDKTRQVAKRHGASTHTIKVSDWHECPTHGKVLAQHFAAARQQSFTYLDPDLDFHLWVDADDVLQGAAHLPALCENLSPDMIGAWFPYHYAAVTRADGESKVNTLFHRERLLRTRLNGRPVMWTWSGRVHETVSPDVQAPWFVAEDIVVVHQQGQHNTPSSAIRNLLLLEIDYEEEDPPSPRTVFYLGNQHFAMGNWQEAVNWYEMLTSGLGNNPYELWQAYIYMSHAYERLGNLTAAAQAAYGAMDVRPEHGEPYFRLGAICVLAGEHEKGIFWNELGRKMSVPPFFVFKNPLDYSFNQRVVQGEALMHLGRVSDAIKEWDRASQVFIDDRLASALTDARKRESDMHVAQAFTQIAERLNGHAYTLYEQLPEDVKAFGRTRDLVMPSLHNSRTGRPRIVFWCGSSWEMWAPPSLNTTGIGGSETAVIQIAKRFAADGWVVDVYNGADRFEGIYDGVGYWDLKRLDTRCDVFVSWRQPGAMRPADADHSILWCHDLNYGPGVHSEMHRWDLVVGVSAWHAKMLGRYYGCAADWVPNGIELERFDQKIEKVPFQCVYASSPDRGLDTLLGGIWPQIVALEPEARLHVGYGWETIDRMIAASGVVTPGMSEDQGQALRARHLSAFKDRITAMIEAMPSVVWRGRLPQDELAKLYGESVAWLYPTDFLEVSCISAMEAMAGGAVPITTACGALPETIGANGLLVPGPTTSRGYQSTYPLVAMGVLSELNTRRTYEAQGRERAKELTWDAAYERWRAHVMGMLAGTRVAVGA